MVHNDQTAKFPVVSLMRDLESPSSSSKPAISAKDIGIISVVDPRALERECFVRCLQMCCEGISVSGYGTIEDWRRETTPKVVGTEVILFNLGASSFSDPATLTLLRDVVESAKPTPVIVLSKAEDLEAMLLAVECGALGFIPPSVRFEDVYEATKMTASGGIFLPRVALMALRRSMSNPPQAKRGLEAHFTERQLLVARALQRGAANKTIAYELNLCESTVKVHIRNIMRKVKATNRTQAAFKLNAIAKDPDCASF